jgi:hypothetical protein
VTTLKNATSESGKFTKNLLSNSPKHKALLNHRQTVYNWLQRCTYDWAGKMRLLPQVGLEKFMKEFNELDKDFKALYLDFKAEYPSMVSDAAFKQGDMFDRAEYPEPDLLDTKFRMRLLVTQVPKSDFRSSISSVIADDLTSQYEEQVKEIIDRAMADASERLVLFASRISNACTEAESNDDGKVKRKKIYESTISQAKEICDTLKAFNLTNNAEIETARAQLEAALDGVSLEDLRESSYVRATVKESVDDMLSKFQPLKVMYD